MLLRTKKRGNTLKFVNLTRNKITIHSDDGIIEIEPTGVPAFTRVSQEVVRKECGIEIVETRFGSVLLPPEKHGIGLIVSKLAAEAIMFQTNGRRGDIYIPNGQIKDVGGRIVGCRGLEHVY